jgi:hypothetical protein
MVMNNGDEGNEENELISLCDGDDGRLNGDDDDDITRCDGDDDKLLLNDDIKTL